MRSSALRSRRKSQGFTLLELLLALSITGVVSVAVYGMLTVSARAQRQAIAAVGTDRGQRQAINLIRRDFESVPRPSGLMAGAFLGADEGRFDSVSFTTANAYLPSENRLADLISVTLRLEPADDDDSGEPPAGGGYQLVRDVVGNLLAATAPPPETQVLYRGITGWDLRYSDGGGWLADWDSTQQEDRMPLAVEVVLYSEPSEDERTERLEITRRAIILLPVGREGESLFDDFGGGF